MMGRIANVSYQVQKRSLRFTRSNFFKTFYRDEEDLKRSVFEKEPTTIITYLFD